MKITITTSKDKVNFSFPIIPPKKTPKTFSFDPTDESSDVIKEMFNYILDNIELEIEIDNVILSGPNDSIINKIAHEYGKLLISEIASIKREIEQFKLSN